MPDQQPAPLIHPVDPVCGSAQRPQPAAAGATPYPFPYPNRKA